MKRDIHEFEIMSPVGSYESLTAAVQGGADSVYFGIEGLNMRSRSANNFTTDDLRTIASICHEHGVKSYLTVNTVIYCRLCGVLSTRQKRPAFRLLLHRM